MLGDAQLGRVVARMVDTDTKLVNSGILKPLQDVGGALIG